MNQYFLLNPTILCYNYTLYNNKKQAYMYIYNGHRNRGGAIPQNIWPTKIIQDFKNNNIYKSVYSNKAKIGS